MSTKDINLTVSDIRTIIKETVDNLADISPEEKKRQMDDSWEELKSRERAEMYDEHPDIGFADDFHSKFLTNSPEMSIDYNDNSSRFSNSWVGHSKNDIFQPFNIGAKWSMDSLSDDPYKRAQAQTQRSTWRDTLAARKNYFSGDMDTVNNPVGDIDSDGVSPITWDGDVADLYEEAKRILKEKLTKLAEDNDFDEEIYSDPFDNGRKFNTRFIIQTRTGAYYLDIDEGNDADLDENIKILSGYVGKTPVSIFVSNEDLSNLINNQQSCEAEYEILDNSNGGKNVCILSYDNSMLNERRYRDYGMSGYAKYEPGFNTDQLSEEENDWLCANFPQEFTIGFDRHEEGDGWEYPHESWDEPRESDVAEVNNAIASIPDEHIKSVISQEFSEWLNSANPDMDYNEPDEDMYSDR